MQSITIYRLADLCKGDRIISYDGQTYVHPRICASPLGPIEPGSPVQGVRLEAPNPQSVIEWVLYPSQMDGRPMEVIRGLEKQPQDEPVPFEETEQGQREKEAQPGFTGPLQGYLDWLDGMLMYGGLTLSEPRPHEWRKDQLFRELRLVTGGFSTDEKLIGRAERGLLGLKYWESSHGGGLFVFLIPESALDDGQIHEWMKPETNVFETIYLVDEIRIPHQGWIVDPEREMVELSCEQRIDENGNIRRTLIVMPDELDDETLRLFHRHSSEQNEG